MRLAIVGSVRLAGNAEALAIVYDVIRQYQPDTVISGGAVGIDTMAADVAKELGVEVREYLPAAKNWEFGYKPRNLLIAHDCDVLVRIASHKSTTYGSGWTRDRAREAGATVLEYIVND